MEVHILSITCHLHALYFCMSFAEKHKYNWVNISQGLFTLGVPVQWTPHWEVYLVTVDLNTKPETILFEESESRSSCICE